MKRFWLILSLLAASAHASTTLTINVSSFTGGTQPGSYVRADLQQCVGAVVPGTGQIIQQTQNFTPNAGVVTAILYDNTAQISCPNALAGAEHNSYYTFTFVYQGNNTLIGSYQLFPGTFNLSGLSALTGPVQVTPGTADTTYVRLDGTNSPTGPGCSPGSNPCALTVPLLLASDPTLSNQAATKQYADTKLSLAGGTLTGPVSAPSASFSGLMTAGLMNAKTTNGINSILGFGADPTYATDSTAAFQAAFSAGGTILVPPGHYKIQCNVLSVPTGVNMIALNSNQGIGGGAGNTSIEGDCPGWDFTYQDGTGSRMIRGISFVNSYKGASAGLAGIFHTLGTTGPDNFEDDALFATDTAIQMNLGVSTDFKNLMINGDHVSPGAASFSRGINANCYNCGFTGGRVYAEFVAYQYSGESWYFNHVDAEENAIVFLQGAVQNAIIENSHFETFGCFWTNASILPTIHADTTTPWGDNGGAGLGWYGAITFSNNLISPNANGSGWGIGAPYWVLKPPPFAGTVIFQNNTSTYKTGSAPKFATVSTSFDYTGSAALAGGSGVRVINFDSYMNVPAVPGDIYTQWTDLANGLNIYGGWPGSISVNGVSLGTLKQPISTFLTLPVMNLTAGQCVTGNVAVAGASQTSVPTATPDYYGLPPQFNVRAEMVTNGGSVNVFVCAVAAGSTAGTMKMNIKVQP